MEQGDRLYQFGPFCLDAGERLLLRNGRLVPLPAKALSTLLVLVRNKGHVVEKDTLMNEVWPDEIVEEGNLAQHIFMLRRALGETTESPTYIETVPRRGYRFLEAGDRGYSPSSATVAGHSLSRQINAQANKLHSLAILPFVNASGNPKAEYLSDGITESIINSLSQLTTLRVLSRNTAFRYKGKELDAQQIGRDLGIDLVLVGKVNILESRLSINVELVDVANGWQLWGENYDRNSEDILDVQDEIAKQISATLRLRLTKDEELRLTKRHTENPEAYRDYLKGRYFWNRFTQSALEKSIDCFRQAIDLDPEYAVAYAGIADSYVRLATNYMSPKEAYPKAKAAAVRALEIDDLLAEAHTALGIIKIRHDWDWDGGREELRRALEINSGYAVAHLFYGGYLDCMGQFDEALEEKRLALELDPLSLQFNLAVAVSLWVMGQPGQALKRIDEILELERDYAPAYLLLGLVHEQTHDYSHSIAALEKAHELDGSLIILASLGRAYAMAGKREEALAVLDKLQAHSLNSFVSSYLVSLIWSGLGEKDSAFDWLEKAYEERDEWLCWLQVDPRLEPLRSDPRFADLLSRVFSPGAKRPATT